MCYIENLHELVSGTRMYKSSRVILRDISQRTQLEMSRLNINTIANIFEIIKCYGETLIEQKIGGLHNRATVTQKTVDEKHEPNTHKKCKLHGICKHTTDQYRALNHGNKKNNNNNNNQKSKSQNLALQNKQSKPKIFQISVEINGNPYKAY
ncbi:hypothetical protein DMUE_2450 [Dictyocoela muelleri]|nr:hypothetical protein DMUE_2450 [Dictyocoela muelleri]